MRSLTRAGAVTAGVSLAAVLAVAAAQATTSTAGTAASTTPTTATATATTTPSDATLAEALAFSREEEKLAHDVYAALATTYPDATVFASIARSETMHAGAVDTLLVRYGVDDPTDGRSAGEFADPDLQAMYDELVAQGTGSLDAAYAVGVTIEERDIADLQAMIAADYPADVDRVLANLLAGSQHHLAAFTAASDGEYAGAGAGSGGATTGSGYGMGMSGQGMSGQDGAGMGARMAGRWSQTS